MPGRANISSDASSEPRLAVRHADAEFALATFENYLLADWRAEITLAAIAHWGRVLQELRGALPGRPLGLLSFLEASCQLPVATLSTDAFSDVLRRHAEAVKGIAVIYPREGFWGAGARSQMTAVMTENKTEIPYVMFPTLEPGAAWLVEAIGDVTQGRASMLQRHVELLRAAPAVAPGNGR